MITIRNNMDFNNFFDGSLATNEEEDKLIDGFSYESTLKLALDVEYVDKVSFLMDCKILLLTVKKSIDKRRNKSVSGASDATF